MAKIRASPGSSGPSGASVLGPRELTLRVYSGALARLPYFKHLLGDSLSYHVSLPSPSVFLLIVSGRKDSLGRIIPPKSGTVGEMNFEVLTF